MAEKGLRKVLVEGDAEIGALLTVTDPDGSNCRHFIVTNVHRQGGHSLVSAIADPFEDEDER